MKLTDKIIRSIEKNITWGRDVDGDACVVIAGRVTLTCYKGETLITMRNEMVRPVSRWELYKRD